MGLNQKPITKIIDPKVLAKSLTKQDESKSWPQILAILIGCIGTFTNGILLAWPSPFIVVISKDKENYDISEEEAAYFTIIPPVGLIFGSLAFFKLNDLIGRKKSLLLLAVPHITFWILVIFAKDVYTFYVARLISGLGDACVFASFPMYIGEISTPKVRGSWGNAMTFFTFGGQFFINIIGSLFGVKMTAYICICLPITFFVLFCFMPESPYYCAMKGNVKKAKESLKFLRGKDEVELEYALLKVDVARQMSESGSWKDLITVRSNRRALIAGVFLRFSQQMSGITVFSAFTQYIFEKAGGNVNPQVSAMIFTGLCCVVILVGGVLLDKFGRKKAFLWSALTCGIVLLIESIYFYLDQFETEIDVSVVNWIPLAGMIVFIFCFSVGMGVVPTLMLGELFSASIKVKGLCCLNIVFGVGIFVTTNLFNLLNTYVGLFCPFLVFSVSCFVSTIMAIYLVPETKGKTLEEIQQTLREMRLERRRRSRTI